MEDGKWLDLVRNGTWAKAFSNPRKNLQYDLISESCYTDRFENSFITYAVCRRYEYVSQGNVYMCIQAVEGENETIQIMVVRSEMNKGQTVRKDQWFKSSKFSGFPFLYDCESSEPGISQLVKIMHDLGEKNNYTEFPNYMDEVAYNIKTYGKRSLFGGILNTF